MKDWQAIIFFFSFILTGSLYYCYIAWRAGLGLSRKMRKRIVILAIIFPLFHGLYFPLSRLYPDLVRGSSYYYLSFSIMGVSLVFLTGLFIRDFFMISGKSYERASKKNIDPERRKFLGKVLNGAVFSGSFLISGKALSKSSIRPIIEKVEVPFRNLHTDLEGLRIVQLTDTHIGPLIGEEFVADVIDRVNQLKPDIVTITGDMIDGRVSNIGHLVRPLGNIQAKYGKFFITGNHEYYWNALEWCQLMSEIGYSVLLNDSQELLIGKSTFAVSGVTDYRAARYIKEHASDPIAAKSKVKKLDFNLLLAHQPRSIYGAEKLGFDLQLSGHTHGGQIFPFNFLVQLVQPYVSGLHDHDGTMIYVSKGTGFWGPPMRFLAPAEISLLILKRKQV